jgi:hypothetical protein
MPFESSFMREFNAAGTPLYLVEAVRIATEPYAERVNWSSFDAGSDHDPILTPLFEVAGGELSTSWECSVGSFTFGVLRSKWRPTDVTRGQVLVLKVGYVGLPVNEFERVAIGRLWTATAQGAEVVITCRDLLALGSRFDVDTSNLGLFGSIEGTVTTTSGRTAGASTLDVVTTTNFEYSETSGGAVFGGVKVTPTTGSPFYLKYAATPGAAQFSAVTGDVWGTTDVDADSGDSVKEIAVIEDHPARIAQRILTSTGTAGDHGSEDDLPATFSFGIPEQYIDDSDIALQVDRTQPSSGNAAWTAISEIEQTNPGAWLRSFLSPGGWFLTMRQGSITVRAVPKLTSPQIRIGDNQIISIDSHDYWSPDVGVEYRRIGATAIGTSTNATATETVTTGPAEVLSDHIIPVYTNESAQLSEVVGRLKLYELRVPERIELTLQGVRADLCIGDEVLLSTRLDTDRQGRALSIRECVIIGLDCGWFEGRSRVVLMMPPDSDAEL